MINISINQWDTSYMQDNPIFLGYVQAKRATGSCNGEQNKSKTLSLLTSLYWQLTGFLVLFFKKPARNSNKKLSESTNFSLVSSENHDTVWFYLFICRRALVLTVISHDSSQLCISGQQRNGATVALPEMLTAPAAHFFLFGCH